MKLKAFVVSRFKGAAKRRILGLMLLALLGLITTISVPALSTQQVEVTPPTFYPDNTAGPDTTPYIVSSRHLTPIGHRVLSGNIVTPTQAQTTNTQLLLQQGIELYESQKFSQAVAVWQRAAAALAQAGDNLTRALVLSDLASAYQELGQWSEAEAASATSINLLQNLKDLTTSQTYWEILAKALNTQGSLEWAQGRLESALSTWKRATATYAKARNQAGVIGSELNQTKALQALGLSHQAEITLEQVNQILKLESDSALKATGLRYLGNALRQVGLLAKSRQVLVQSAQLAGPTTAKALAMLELGNTERALSNRALAIGKKQEAIAHTQSAITFYQQATDLGQQIQPQLNHLSLLVETGQWSEASQLWPQVHQAIATLPPSRIASYAQLNLARSLTCLHPGIDIEAISCRNSERREQLPVQNQVKAPPSWQKIAQILATVVQQARSLQDLRAESYALGQLGELYKLTGQWSAARTLTQLALFIAEEIQAPEIRYRWEWQLGRLLAKQGDSNGAIASLTAAVETLKSVRSDLLTINSDVQFSFRDQAEPVYRELVDLLLRPQGRTQPSQENLKRALAGIDALQVAELEDFLGCNLGQTVAHKQNLDTGSRTAAFIYPIILKDRLEVIFKLPGQPIGHFWHPVQQAVVSKTIGELRRALLGRNGGQVRVTSLEVYRWLLEPLEPQLERSSEVETLVFVLDGDLRNIPMAVLYDGKANEYLIEKKYALAVLPNASLFDLQARPRRLKVLGAGITTQMDVENRYFDKIDAEAELQQVKLAASSKILLDSQFTQANLQRELNSGDFDAVHLATHGNFSSDPEETFILAYKELLKSNDLENLLTIGKLGATDTIELLVLSACQTAVGDSRATLGLAGLTVRSGVRSTLATLWQVSDESTVKLMEQFYKDFYQPGVSKAQKLHRAQQALLKEPKYQNPYYWAPYVLVGNWL